MKAWASFLLLAIAHPSFAQVPSEQAAPVEAAEKPVCRSLLQTGTRFGNRTCRPAADWRELDRRTVNGDGSEGLGAGIRQQDARRFGPAGRL